MDEYCKHCDLYNRRNGTNYPDHHDLLTACPWQKKDLSSDGGPTELDLALERLSLKYPPPKGARKP